MEKKFIFVGILKSQVPGTLSDNKGYEIEDEHFMQELITKYYRTHEY